MTGFNLFNTNASTPTTQTTPFGISSQPNQQNLFGANTSTFGTQSTSAFGAQPNATFGAQASSTFGVQPSSTFVSQAAPTFGVQPTSTFAAQPAPAFNAQTTTQTASLGSPASSSNLSFNLPKTQNLTFGTVTAGAAPTSQNLTFGAPSSQSNISFGTPTGQSTAFGSSGTLPGFGSLKPQTSVAGSSTLFGTSSPNVQTSLLGSTTPVVSAAKPMFGGLSTLGSATVTPQTKTTISGISLASSSAAPTTTVSTLGFGLGSTTQTSFGTPTLNTSAATTTAANLGGLNFGVPATSTVSFSSLGTTTTAATTTATSILGSAFGVNIAATTAGEVFSWQKSSQDAPTTSTPSLGLGGLDHTAVSTAQSIANTVVSAKEQMLPNEIQQTVGAFKGYIKNQKNLSSEVARTSAEPLTKLTQQISALNNLILTLGSILSQQKFTAEKIKLETIKSLNDYELAQKIKDSPVASEERMYAIRKYFVEKISAFEENAKTLQEKIEYVYQHVITLPQENSLSAEALKLIVKKLHDSFVVIGARAYKLHNDMQLLKVQYLTLRNQYVKDNSSISFSLNRELQLPFSDRSKSNAFSLEGPNPFSRTANRSFNSLLLTSQHRNYQSTTSKDWGMGGFNATKPFGFGDMTGNPGFDQSNSDLNLSGGQQFNLQKPPIGNKRGKR